MAENKAFPEKISDVFYKLQAEIIWLHGRWIIFEQLYSKSNEIVELLNESASMYFYITQKTLFYDVLMSLSRILDKPYFGKDKNLSLELIIKPLDEDGFSDLIIKLQEILKNIENQKSVLKKHRNKFIAHKDLDQSLNKAEYIKRINVSDIKDILESIRDFMNECEFYFLGTNTRYEFYRPTGGRKLITQLKKAKAYDELEKIGLIERGYWINALRKNESENKI